MSENLRAYTRALYAMDAVAARVADDQWDAKSPCDEWSAREVLGHVIWGTRAVAARAQAFGMQVMASDPFAEAMDAGTAGISLVSLADIFRNCDVISLHCNLTDSNHHMLDQRAFGLMERKPILINVARGALIDSQALADALGNGDIRAAAIDVLPKEPPVDGDPLLDYQGDNLIVTPHIAWGTWRARQNAIDELTANIAAWLDGERRCRVD